MRKVIFLKEPAYVYDLYYVFMLYFNKEYYENYYRKIHRIDYEVEYFDRILKDYLPISSDLLLFFYIPPNKLSFMTQYYFEPYYKRFFSGDFSLDVVQIELTKYEDVIDNVIRYYFDNATEEQICQCKASMVVANEMIKDTDYSYELKSALYSFLIDPVSMIRKLSYELMTKEFLLSKEYEKRYSEIIGLQNSFDYEKIVLALRKSKIQWEPEKYKRVYISVWQNCINMIKTFKYENEAMILLGKDVLDFVERLEGEMSPDLEEFGQALAEKNRVEILYLIANKEEVSIGDIERELGLTNTNTYYHLSLMIKVGVLVARKQGKMVLYSVNKEYVDLVSVNKDN